jgi:Ni/Fe-hydrogenase subunit HybB-like protein
VVALVGNPARAWQAYLLNFLFFSAIAQGAVLFSALMHTVKARWSGPLADVAESFAAFFPVSLILFVILFLGQQHVFPWLHEDLHGKEVWLNVPFMFGRDLFGLCLLYGFGLAFLYHRLYFTLKDRGASGPFGRWLLARWDQHPPDEARLASRMTVFGILYLLAFALVLSLVGYDLVMATDPHWYSTLFGAYTFVKAIFIGFGALIVLSSLLHLSDRNGYHVEENQFHDIGKLFFAFCLVWADFFYAQFVVIWYGNIPEETAYVIERTMAAPWNVLAWIGFHRLLPGPVSDSAQPSDQNQAQGHDGDLSGGHDRNLAGALPASGPRLSPRRPIHSFGLGGSRRGHRFFGAAGRCRYQLFPTIPRAAAGWRRESAEG